MRAIIATMSIAAATIRRIYAHSIELPAMPSAIAGMVTKPRRKLQTKLLLDRARESIYLL